MTHNEKTRRLGILRQNMANKMAAGMDYSYEEEQISKLTAECADHKKKCR